MRNKTVAGMLALFFGAFGVHRFYLGKRFQGILHMFVFFFTFIITVSENPDFPLFLIPGLIGFVDAVLLFAMPQEEFDDRYNEPLRRKIRNRQQRAYGYSETQTTDNYRYNQYSSNYETPKREGIRLFREYDFEGARTAFLEALDVDSKDPSIHFNLACTYSMLEDASKSFLHLEEAISYGFSDIRKIHEHKALSYIRSLVLFDQFVENGYRQIKQLPAETPIDDSVLDLENKSKMDNLLQQIRQLADLRDKGILTNEEFSEQKRKILEKNN